MYTKIKSTHNEYYINGLDTFTHATILLTHSVHRTVLTCIQKYSGVHKHLQLFSSSCRQVVELGSPLL